MIYIYECISCHNKIKVEQDDNFKISIKCINCQGDLIKIPLHLTVMDCYDFKEITERTEEERKGLAKNIT